MKKLILISLLFVNTAFANNEKCNDLVYRVARAVDAISHEEPTESYKLVSTKLTSSKESGGEMLNTIRVHMVVNEDMATIWDVDVHSSFCLVKNVRFVTGD